MRRASITFDVKRKKRRSSFPYQALLRIAAFAIFTQAAAAGCSGCGCLTCEQAMYETEYSKERDHQVEKFEYDVPVVDAWKELVDLAKEQGFTLPTSGTEDTNIDSDWVGSGTTDRQRLQVRVERIDPKHYKIRIERQIEMAIDGGTTVRSDRDRELEWQLIERAQPTRAKEIEDKADQAGQRGGRVGRGCDRGCDVACTACVDCADACDRCNKSAKRLSP